MKTSMSAFRKYQHAYFFSRLESISFDIHCTYVLFVIIIAYCVDRLIDTDIIDLLFYYFILMNNYYRDNIVDLDKFT